MEAFDSNVSAKYGQFTGDVVNADLIDPDTTRQSGKISYRTTRDDWAKFHYSEIDQTDIDNHNLIDGKKNRTKNTPNTNTTLPTTNPLTTNPPCCFPIISNNLTS